MLSIDEAVARSFVSTMGLKKFDKTVGKLLMDAGTML